MQTDGQTDTQADIHTDIQTGHIVEMKAMFGFFYIFDIELSNRCHIRKLM